MIILTVAVTSGRLWFQRYPTVILIFIYVTFCLYENTNVIASTGSSRNTMSGIYIGAIKQYRRPSFWYSKPSDGRQALCARSCRIIWQIESRTPLPAAQRLNRRQFLFRKSVRSVRRRTDVTRHAGSATMKIFPRVSRIHLLPIISF